MLSCDTTFVDLIELENDGAGRWVGPPGPEPSGRTYGGQFMAQGLAAAYLTVTDDRWIHSLQATFLSAGDVNESTVYQVETMRDGRSFSTRSVGAFQKGIELFRMVTSFHVPEEGFDYQTEIPRLSDHHGPATSGSVGYTDYTTSHPDTELHDEWPGSRRPIEISYLNPPPHPVETGHTALEPVTEAQVMWQKISGDLPQDPTVHNLGLAYMSDSTLVDHVTLPHGYRWQDNRLTGTTLGHSMWFHHPTRIDQWVFYDQKVEATSGGRGLVSGKIYDKAGLLVASCVQEGLMRWTEPVESS